MSAAELAEKLEAWACAAWIDISTAALRRHSSLNRRSMPRTGKDVAGRVHVAIVRRAAVRTGPLPYSKVCDTFRPRVRQTAARRADLGCQIFAHLFVHGSARNRFIAELVPQGGPAGIQNRLRHAGLGEPGRVNVTHGDIVEFSGDAIREPMQKVAPRILNAGVDVDGLTLLAGALGFPKLVRKLLQMAWIGNNLAAAERGQLLQAKVNADSCLLLTLGHSFDLNDEVQVPASTGILAEAGPVLDLGTFGKRAAFEDAIELPVEDQTFIAPAQKLRAQRNPCKIFLASIAEPGARRAALSITRTNGVNRHGIELKLYGRTSRQVAEIKAGWPTFAPPYCVALNVVTVVPNEIHGARLAPQIALKRLHAVAIGQKHPSNVVRFTEADKARAVLNGEGQ